MSDYDLLLTLLSEVERCIERINRDDREEMPTLYAAESLERGDKCVNAISEIITLADGRRVILKMED